jgi:hypothetical protein
MHSEDIIWCVHQGNNTTVAECPYTIKTGITCSMPHKDKPDGKFKEDSKHTNKYNI